jgi:predicted RNA methylase
MTMPEPDPTLSQWFTPPWLARRAAAWIPPHARVLEPACGAGALLEALLARGHRPDLLLGVELDQRWAIHTGIKTGVRIIPGCFLTNAWVRQETAAFLPDVVFMNPPFEDNAHMGFVIRALEIARVVVGIFPASFAYSKTRDRNLWATKAYVACRAILPARVDYGGEMSGKSDSVVLKIKRRDAPRRAGEVLEVFEEVWNEPEAQ